MLAVGHTLQERYQIEEVLGAGGMGTVYRAVQLSLSRRVAVKEMHRLTPDETLHGKFVQQFETEAKMLSCLSHPNLVPILDYFVDNGTPYFVMAYIDGKNLETWRRQGAFDDEAKARPIVDAIASVLEYLHRQDPPVLLRDLKPANVLVTAEGRVHVIDFGIARWQEDGQMTGTAIRGAVTDGYSPLEQYGGGTTDARSDLYALGATWLFLLTGQAPPSATRRVSENAPLPDPRSVNPSVSEQTWAVIGQLMSLRREERPATVAELRGMLTADALSPDTLPPRQDHRSPSPPVKPPQETVPTAIPPPAPPSSPRHGFATAPTVLAPPPQPKPRSMPSEGTPAQTYNKLAPVVCIAAFVAWYLVPMLKAYGFIYDPDVRLGDERRLTTAYVVLFAIYVVYCWLFSYAFSSRLRLEATLRSAKSTDRTAAYGYLVMTVICALGFSWWLTPFGLTLLERLGVLSAP